MCPFDDVIMLTSNRTKPTATIVLTDFDHHVVYLILRNLHIGLQPSNKLRSTDIRGSVTHWIICYWWVLHLMRITLHSFFGCWIQCTGSRTCIRKHAHMMTSSNGNIFRVTGLCAGNSPVTGEFSAQRPVTRSFDVFFDLRLNKRLSK